MVIAPIPPAARSSETERSLRKSDSRRAEKIVRTKKEAVNFSEETYTSAKNADIPTQKNTRYDFLVTFEMRFHSRIFSSHYNRFIL